MLGLLEGELRGLPGLHQLGGLVLGRGVTRDQRRDAVGVLVDGRVTELSGQVGDVRLRPGQGLLDARDLLA